MPIGVLSSYSEEFKCEKMKNSSVKLRLFHSFFFYFKKLM